MKKWLVFYTKSRHEKKVRDYLVKRGHDVFLPMQKVLRQWSDRKKKVEVPLFNSYIFVLESEDKIPIVLQTPGVSWNIRHNDKPAFLRQEEMDMIQRFIATGLFIETGMEENLTKGDLVEVIDGLLKGSIGRVVRTKEGERFLVVLESIHQNLLITLDPLVLKKV